MQTLLYVPTYSNALDPYNDSNEVYAAFNLSFADEVMKAQRGEVISPRSHSL